MKSKSSDSGWPTWLLARCGEYRALRRIEARFGGRVARSRAADRRDSSRGVGCALFVLCVYEFSIARTRSIAVVTASGVICVMQIGSDWLQHQLQP